MGDFLKPHGSSDDQRIGQALSDVPIPIGLAERINAALTSPAISTVPAELSSGNKPNALGQVDVLSDALHCPPTPGSDASPRPSSSEEPVRVLPVIAPRQRNSDILRRSLLALACASMLGGFAYLANRWQQPLERNWLVAHTQFVLEQWEQQNPVRLENGGFTLSSSVQQQLVRTTITGSISLKSLGSKLDGTLYRLDAQDGRGIVLIKLTNLPPIRGLSNRFTPLSSPSGGWSLAAMTVNNETFVLAAVGTEQQLFAYIHAAAVT